MGMKAFVFRTSVHPCFVAAARCLRNAKVRQPSDKHSIPDYSYWQISAATKYSRPHKKVQIRVRGHLFCLAERFVSR
jgi:hypothetical protein